MNIRMDCRLFVGGVVCFILMAPSLFADVIDGDSGNNILQGTEGDDLIYGYSGNDTISGGEGNDILDGGAGDDTFFIQDANGGQDQIRGGDGYDSILGKGGDDVIDLSQLTADHSIEYIDAGYGNDTVIGSSFADTIASGSGNNTLNGGAGDDKFLHGGTYGRGVNHIIGGEGFDTLEGTADGGYIYFSDLLVSDSLERIQGAAVANKIRGTEGDNTLDFSATELINISVIDGLGGNDIIVGSSGNDTIYGGEGNDILEGGAGDDTFYIKDANGGQDQIRGGDGYDSILGKGGDDVIDLSQLTADHSIEYIDAGYGNDTVIGSSFADTIASGSGNNTLNGGAGDDTFLHGGTYGRGVNHIIGGEGFDTLEGTADGGYIYFSDLLVSDSLERIQGAAVANKIRGTEGDNTLDFSATELINIGVIDGLGGNDIIISSSANDMIQGGTGNDTYRFSAGDGQDVIRDEASDFATSMDRLEFIDIAHERLWFNQSGNDLKIRIIGSGDQITVDDWYLGLTYQLDEIEASNGRVLARENVDQLVSAMAAHPIPESVDAVIPQSVLDVSAQTWSDESSATNTPPIVSIATPSANAEYTDGDSVSFTATASDSEDGDISTGINWSSDLDGSLGSGASVNVSALSVGTHIITVAVVDSASAAANDSIVVTVAASVGDASVVYVSDMPWVTETNGWGVAERDRSNGELAADDGNPITLDGVVYPKGIGAHANSEITVDLNGDYEQFTSMVGLDDEINPNGSVVFEIYGDDQPLFQSGVHVSSTAAEAVDISVAGVNTLRLVITNAGDGNSYDHADWADAQLHLPSGYSAPDTIIVAPVNNSVTTFGETLILVGSANDTQDGDVSNSLQWTSNLDGLLGAGTSLSIGTLSIGQHTITATATDSDGTVGNAVIVLTVAATPVTPKALISASGSAIVFNEAVSSPSGRLGISNIPYEQLWFSRSGNDLQIDVVGSDEQIIINGWYLGSSYQFDGIEASDGRVLARDQVDQLVNAMAVFAIPEGVGAVIPQSALDNLLQVWPSVWVSSP